MNSKGAGVLALLLLVSLACQGILIPECRDCHVGKLTQEAPAGDDGDCDHCEHLHGNPQGCSHRPVGDSAVRSAIERATPAPDAAISAIESISTDSFLASPAPVAAASCGREAHAATCGVLRC